MENVLTSRFERNVVSLPAEKPLHAHAVSETVRRERLSIIVPTLNEEKLLRETLRQFPKEFRSAHNIELIVSDGGSTDATLTIAEELADVVVRHNGTHRQTIAEGRNHGARVATGDVLVFLNADTVFAEPHSAIEKISSILATCPDVVALAFPVAIAPGERTVSDAAFHTFFNFYVRLLNGCGINFARGECNILRAGTFRSLGGYDERLAAGEDFELYTRIRGNVFFLRDVLVYESPRRYRKFGYMRILAQWFANAVSGLLRHRSYSKEWETVR